MKVGMKFSKIGFFDVIPKKKKILPPLKMKVVKPKPCHPILKKNIYQNNSDLFSLKSGRRKFKY